MAKGGFIVQASSNQISVQNGFVNTFLCLIILMVSISYLHRDDLAVKGRSLGLEVCVISDAGRTQISPGSKTVLGVGPGKSFIL